MFPIGSEMVDTPQKLSNDHAHDAQTCCLGDKAPDFFEHGLQSGAIGQIESLTDMLVKRFAQGSSLQSAIASASAVLQSTDEMKMAELNDPALGCAKFYNSGNLVGNRCPDPFVYRGRNGRERVRPTLHVLSAWLQHRIEKHRSSSMAGFKRHHIQNPIFSSKSKIQPVQDQNQWSFWQTQNPSAGHKPPHGLTPTVPHCLLRQANARRQSLQQSPLHQNGFQQSRSISPTSSASSLYANAPGSLATTALTTSRSKAINFRSATTRFRVQTIHARELATDCRSKYGKSLANLG
jgi:hypothetical protein